MRVLLLITVPMALWAQQLPKNPDAQNGKKLFENYGCYECHGRLAQGGSAGAAGSQADSLSGVHELRPASHRSDAAVHSQGCIG